MLIAASLAAAPASETVSQMFRLLLLLLLIFLTEITVNGPPCGSTSLAIFKASELAKSEFAGVMARMRQFSRTMNSMSMLRIWISMSGGWSPTGTFVMPGRSISVRFNTDTQQRMTNWLIDWRLTALSAQKGYSLQLKKSEISEKVDNVMCWEYVQNK